MATPKPKNPTWLGLQTGKFSSRAGKARLSRLQVYLCVDAVPGGHQLTDQANRLGL